MEGENKKEEKVLSREEYKEFLEELAQDFPQVKKVNLDGLTIAVDFDGTCVTHEYPNVGRDIGAAPVLRYFVKRGAKLILWTMRSGKELEDAVNWFKENDIELYGSQRNPTQDNWTDSPKAYAHVYIDDAAFGCPLIPAQRGERAYVDWAAVGTSFGYIAEIQTKCFHILNQLIEDGVEGVREELENA